MKTRASVKLICKHCSWEKRKNRLYVRCDLNPKHKQRQLFSSNLIFSNDDTSFSSEISNNLLNSNIDNHNCGCGHIEMLKNKINKSNELKIVKNTLI